MKTLLLFLGLFIITACNKEYEMVYRRGGTSHTEVIKAKDDVDAYDKATLKQFAMIKVANDLEKKGLTPPLGEPPSYFTLYCKEKEVIVPIEVELNIRDKYEKLSGNLRPVDIGIK